jgi:hypothetical protein
MIRTLPTFPTLDGVAITCSTLNVVTPEFNAIKDDAKKYVVSDVRTTPVAVVKLDIDEFGRKRHVSVALQSWEVDLMIDSLQVAKQQIQFLDSRLKKGAQ